MCSYMETIDCHTNEILFWTKKKIIFQIIILKRMYPILEEFILIL
jgi:hypothetical protein